MAMNLVDRTALDAALTATADAIRAKTGGSADLTFDLDGEKGFEAAVENSGLVKPSGNKSITASTSTQTGIDVSGYATVSVAPTPTEAKTATANGTVTPTSGKFLSSVLVNVPQETPTLIEKTITQNGTYNASDDSADGYSKVTVAVSGGGGATIVEEENEFGGITLTITE